MRWCVGPSKSWRRIQNCLRPSLHGSDSCGIGRLGQVDIPNYQSTDRFVVDPWSRVVRSRWSAHCVRLDCVMGAWRGTTDEHLAAAPPGYAWNLRSDATSDLYRILAGLRRRGHIDALGERAVAGDSHRGSGERRAAVGI
jgi:hypothetical protein